MYIFYDINKDRRAGITQFYITNSRFKKKLNDFMAQKKKKMATLSIIKDLKKAINAKESPEKIAVYKELLVKNIVEATQAPIFFSLPFSDLSEIINKVDFLDIDKPVELISTIIQNTSEFHKKEAILLLNDLKYDSFPQLTLEELFKIISNFKNSDFLTKFYELNNEEKQLLKISYDSNKELKTQINTLKEELKKKDDENKELKNRNSELESILTAILEEPMSRKSFREDLLDFETLSTKIPSVLIEPKSKSESSKSDEEESVSKSESESEKKTEEIKKPTNFEENLFEACEKGDIESVKYHYEVLHADKELTDESGYTSLQIAVIYNNLPIVKYLCEKQHVNCDAKNHNGRTALHFACCYGHIEIVKYLCEVQKVDKEAKDIDGQTPLHIACEYGDKQIAQYLCDEQHVNLESKDSKGQTPLHIACRYGILPIVKYLCEDQQVNIKAKNNDGKTPYTIAVENGQSDIASYLHKVYSIDDDGSDSSSSSSSESEKKEEEKGE